MGGGLAGAWGVLVHQGACHLGGACGGLLDSWASKSSAPMHCMLELAASTSCAATWIGGMHAWKLCALLARAAVRDWILHYTKTRWPPQSMARFRTSVTPPPPPAPQAPLEAARPAPPPTPTCAWPRPAAAAGPPRPGPHRRPAGPQAQRLPHALQLRHCQLQATLEESANHLLSPQSRQ